MKIKVYTVTLDGDNVPVETHVFATEQAARDYLIEAIESYGDEVPAGTSDEELTDRWESTADGVCQFEEHELDITPAAVAG